MNIRRLTDGDDLVGAIHLLQRFFREEGFDIPDDVIAANAQRLAGIAQCGLFIAEDGRSCIGVATVSMEFGIEYGWSAEMGDLYVVLEWRGKGVSRTLLGAVEAFLKEHGARGYQVTVTPFARDHHDLARYYERLGFEDEGRVILYKKL